MRHSTDDSSASPSNADLHGVIAQIVIQVARQIATLRKEQSTGSKQVPQKIQQTAARLSLEIDDLEIQAANRPKSDTCRESKLEHQKMLARIQDLRLSLHSELAVLLDPQPKAVSGKLAESMAALIAAETTTFPELSLN